MENNKNHPKTNESIEVLRNKFCNMHVTPVGEVQFMIKSPSAHQTSLLFKKIADELNKAHENE